MLDEEKQSGKSYIQHEPILPMHFYVDLHVCIRETARQCLKCFLSCGGGVWVIFISCIFQICQCPFKIWTKVNVFI